MRVPALSVLAASVLACSHSDPFGGVNPGSVAPPGSGNPLRLTYNIGKDWAPSWSVDGTEVYYSAQDSARPDRDACLVAIPAAGGVRRTVRCGWPIPNDTLEEFEEPALRGELLAYATARMKYREHTLPERTIEVRSARGTGPGTVVLTFPQFPGIFTHDLPFFLDWLSDSVLLYLGARSSCCLKDSFEFGVQGATIDLRGPAPVLTILSGTDSATSVDPSDDGQSVYFTRNRDTRVYQLSPGGGPPTLVHDFGVGHVVRDVEVTGNRLIAVVDGRPGLRVVDPFDTVQVDQGGVLVEVDLQTGQEARFPAQGRLYRRPALDRSGHRLVVEGYPFTVFDVRDPNGNFLYSDTLVQRAGDLWRYDLP